MTKNSLLTHEDILSAPIQDGDAGIVLKADGTFKVFSTHAIDGDSLTPAQREQGEKLIALSIALKYPEIISILKQMANDPNLVGEGLSLPAQLN